MLTCFSLVVICVNILQWRMSSTNHQLKLSNFDWWTPWIVESIDHKAIIWAFRPMGENETKQTGYVMLTLRLHGFKARFGKRWQIATVEDAHAIIAVHPLVLVICPADKLTPSISINLCSTQPSSLPRSTPSSCLSQARGTVLPAGSDRWRCWLWTDVDCT